MTTELRLSRTLSFPVDRVWQALTDPVALAAWFWPERFATTAQVDLRVGGRYRIDGPGSGMAVAGEYTAVEPPHRLAFTWQWDGETDQTLVTVELTPSDAGTELLIVHSRFATEADRDSHAQGWTDCLGRLPGWLGTAIVS
jgi:uncharacterized protein YndB with AHSA1/START domain